MSLADHPTRSLGDSPPSPERTSPAPLAPGDHVGRYSVIEQLGQGGMGVVYAAHDPQLGRRVAIKLLHRDRRSSEDDLRLLREAQTLAQLKHPNVVAVHDAGLTEHGVFVTMELLEGEPLDAWLQLRPRRVSEILAVFRAAGQGLLAAHDAGIVHRDFKPSNVLVEADGTAKVLDFGLARILQETPSQPLLRRPDPSPREGSDPGPLELDLTDPGTVMGTPVFMAPELFEGAPNDHRSEQFAFAMSLFGALYGRPTGWGAPLEERGEAIERWRRKTSPERAASGEAIPARVRRVIARGLATDPAERFDSLAEMIALLEEQPRRWGEIAALVAMALGFGVGAMVFAPTGDPPCLDASVALEGTWGAPERAAVQAAFDRAGASSDLATQQRVQARLDDYAADWVGMYTASCRATFVDHRQTERLFDQRMRCLQRRRNRLDSVIASLTTAPSGASLVQRTLAAFRLPPIEPCADRKHVISAGPLPRDRAERARLAQLRGSLDRAATHYDAGEYLPGIDLAQAVVDHPQISEHPTIHAEALETLGRLQVAAMELTAAEQTLSSAIRVGAASHEERTVAAAWTHLLFAVTLRRPEDARMLELPAWAAADRAGDEVVRSWLLNDLGVLYHLREDTDAAIDYLRRAVRTKEQQLGEGHVDVGISWFNLSQVLTGPSRFEEAEDALDNALQRFEATIGPGHPLTQRALFMRCQLRRSHRDDETALAQCTRVVETLERSGSAAPWLGHAYLHLACVQHALGQPDRARHSAEQAPAHLGTAGARWAPAIARWVADPQSLPELCTRAWPPHLAPPAEAAEAADPGEAAEAADPPSGPR